MQHILENTFLWTESKKREREGEIGSERERGERVRGEKERKRDR